MLHNNDRLVNLLEQIVRCVIIDWLICYGTFPLITQSSQSVVTYVLPVQRLPFVARDDLVDICDVFATLHVEVQLISGYMTGCCGCSVGPICHTI